MIALDSIYAAVAADFEPQATRQATIQRFVDVLWDALRDCDVSWLGFYIDHPNEPDDRRLVLGPHRDSPACSPIGLHGVCGTALLSRSTILVDDVRDLGDDYVTCNPRDRAEIVVALVTDNVCWGVLDLDSFTPGRFSSTDRSGLHAALNAAGLHPADADI